MVRREKDGALRPFHMSGVTDAGVCAISDDLLTRPTGEWPLLFRQETSKLVGVERPPGVDYGPPHRAALGHLRTFAHAIKCSVERRLLLRTGPPSRFQPIGALGNVGR